jgi:hypothetical protein
VHRIVEIKKHAPFFGCFALALFFLTTGCSKKINHRTFPASEIIPSANTHPLDIDGKKEPVQILYLGCGHLAIRFHQEIILIDPFFSTQGFTKSKISSDSIAFKKYKKILATHAFGLSTTKSLWIAHTHYDHMMDIPLLLKTGTVPSAAAIYGNAFGDDILKNFITTQYHPLDTSEVYDPENSTGGKWFNASSSIRVLPIRSDHAPHYKFLGIPIHLMLGDINPLYFESSLKEPYDKTKRNNWKEGVTYSYLIDFMHDERIDTRIFVQTSGSHFPLGMPPAEELKKRQVDVAFLCVASANYVKPYPIQVMDTLKAQKTIFIHWEDFFRDPLDFNARFVRFSNFRKLHRRLAKSGYPITKDRYVMPRPGTLLTIQ